MKTQRARHKQTTDQQLQERQPDFQDQERQTSANDHPDHPSSSGLRLPSLLRPAQIIHLQRTLGNQAVQRMFASEAHNRIQKSNSIAIQRETVAGIRNDTKTATEIGDDMHRLVQHLFLNGSMSPKFKLYTEFPVGGGRADLVAMYIEEDDDGEGGSYIIDQQIFVGEIKPDSSLYQPGVRGAGPSQLANYIQLFKQAYPQARVGLLNFWNPPTDGQRIGGNGYDCFVYIRNAKNGMYYYKGRVNEQYSYAAHNGDSDSEAEEPFV